MRRISDNTDLRQSTETKYQVGTLSAKLIGMRLGSGDDSSTVPEPSEHSYLGLFPEVEGLSPPRFYTFAKCLTSLNFPPQDDPSTQSEEDFYNFGLGIEGRDFISLLENVDKLQSFSKLKKGWNGYDADPIPKSVIERAHALLMAPEFPGHEVEVFPTARESVQLEMRLEDGSYLEVEVFENHYVIFIRRPTGEEVEQVDSIGEVFSTVQAFNV